MSNLEERADLYDAVIVGGGPAGLTAALYLARARYRVLVVERERFGGQITITDEVINYPGVKSASGSRLAETMRQQAESFGAEFMLAEVVGLEMDGDVKRVVTSRGNVECFAVLLATGASPRRLGFAGEEEFRGRGVAYCATCDGEFFQDKEVFVIGGGFAAAEESVFLTRYAKHVTVLVREDDFTCAPAAAEPTKSNSRIDVLYNTEIVEAGGDGMLSFVRYRNAKTGAESEFRAPEGENIGVFVFVGYAPGTSLVADIVELDDSGYILTDAHQMTNVDGLFAAGDVCAKSLRQVATAVGEAALAATEMERFLKSAQERTGLKPTSPASRPAQNGSRGSAQSGSSEVGDHAADASSDDSSSASRGSLFTPEMVAQLEAVFGRMERNLTLELALDDGSLSSELKGYVEELASLTEKLDARVLGPEEAASLGEETLPCVRVCADGAWTGLAFHGVPGGHEFTSFVLGLYNASGPGQQVAEADREAIESMEGRVSVKVLVSLSCTMCPDTVVAAQRIASLAPNVSAEVFDVAHFPQIRERYNAMSVPCTVMAGEDGREKVVFGKKDLPAMLREVQSL